MEFLRARARRPAGRAVRPLRRVHRAAVRRRGAARGSCARPSSSCRGRPVEVRAAQALDGRAIAETSRRSDLHEPGRALSYVERPGLGPARPGRARAGRLRRRAGRRAGRPAIGGPTGATWVTAVPSLRRPELCRPGRARRRGARAAVPAGRRQGRDAQPQREMENSAQQARQRRRRVRGGAGRERARRPGAARRRPARLGLDAGRGDEAAARRGGRARSYPLVLAVAAEALARPDPGYTQARSWASWPSSASRTTG